MMTLNAEKKFKRQITGEIECFMQTELYAQKLFSWGDKKSSREKRLRPQSCFFKVQVYGNMYRWLGMCLMEARRQRKVTAPVRWPYEDRR